MDQTIKVELIGYISLVLGGRIQEENGSNKQVDVRVNRNFGVEKC